MTEVPIIYKPDYWFALDTETYKLRDKDQCGKDQYTTY